MERSDLLSFFLVTSGLNRWYGQHVSGPGFPILTWHEVSAKSFAAQLKVLSAYYRIMRLEDALAWQAPESSRPPLVLTFDDGYKSWLTEVVPVLRKKRLPAYFFPATGFLDRTVLPWYEVVERVIRRHRLKQLEVSGEVFTTRALARDPAQKHAFFRLLKRLPSAELNAFSHRLEYQLTPEDRTVLDRRYLTWDELRSIASYDLEIGSHTISHPILSRMPAPLVRDELVRSKHRLEEQLNRPITCFAWPNGAAPDLSAQAEQLLEEAGYQFGLTALPGWNKPGEPRLRLRRAGVAPASTLWRLRTTATGLLGQLHAQVAELRGGE